MKISIFGNNRDRWYWVSMGWYWLVQGGAWSVLGDAGW